MTTQASLIERGFDNTPPAQGVYPRYLRPTCSRCEPLVINGTPTHETGCPNTPGECKWCGSTTEERASFYDDSCYRSYYGHEDERCVEEEEAAC